ncbi:MAG: type IV secretion system DotC family protein [Alphaproteobacteria bacterium]|nr:type IV secretion system DotC family protein [Alphaproteobacteria bacterium]
MKSRNALPIVLGLMVLMTGGLSLPAAAATDSAGYTNLQAGVSSTPPTLDSLKNVPKEQKEVAQDSGLPFDIRKEAQKEAAISYGARGGLAFRTYQIRQEIQLRAPYLDKVYNFSELLIPAPSGFLIEPPIITEVENAMIIDGGGQEAAVSDRIYNIITNAKIVSNPRSWREYLEREWGDVEPPPDILRPNNDDERREWSKQVQIGWEQGMAQANEIFEEDLNRLMADFQGMVRFRMLLSQGMISAPYALQTDRGVTGGGSEMRVGDRAVEITDSPSLISEYDKWRPANR